MSKTKVIAELKKVLPAATLEFQIRDPDEKRRIIRMCDEISTNEFTAYLVELVKRHTESIPIKLQPDYLQFLSSVNNKTNIAIHARVPAVTEKGFCSVKLTFTLNLSNL